MLQDSNVSPCKMLIFCERLKEQSQILIQVIWRERHNLQKLLNIMIVMRIRNVRKYQYQSYDLHSHQKTKLKQKERLITSRENVSCLLFNCFSWNEFRDESNNKTVIRCRRIRVYLVMIIIHRHQDWYLLLYLRHARDILVES